MTASEPVSILAFLPPLAREQLTRERIDLLGEIAQLRGEADQQRIRAEAAEAELREIQLQRREIVAEAQDEARKAAGIPHPDDE